MSICPIAFAWLAIAQFGRGDTSPEPGPGSLAAIVAPDQDGWRVLAGRKHASTDEPRTSYVAVRHIDHEFRVGRMFQRERGTLVLGQRIGHETFRISLVREAGTHLQADRHRGTHVPDYDPYQSSTVQFAYHGDYRPNTHSSVAALQESRIRDQHRDDSERSAHELVVGRHDTPSGQQGVAIALLVFGLLGVLVGTGMGIATDPNLGFAARLCASIGAVIGLALLIALMIML